MNFILIVPTLLMVAGVPSTLAAVQEYKIGVGRADCTGPSVEIGFMGYAKLNERGAGIHLRQFSRAFIVDDGSKRVVFVSVDVGMIGHEIKRDVVARLQNTYGDIYSMDNVVLSGTHTHSAPGGFLMNLLYDISVLGFVPQTFAALVDGIHLSIVRAHENVEPGHLQIATTTILDVNINRSPTSYLQNPQEERAQYEYNVDKTLTQIRFHSVKDGLIGAINWYAVHPTSMNNSNHLVSSDNVGLASLLLEREKNPNNLPGKGRFVGAFSSSNLGDVSPNIMGPKCQSTGNPCDIFRSACPAGEGDCIASGPGDDMFESTKIIATRLYKGASDLLMDPKAEIIEGSIDFIHQFVDMPNYKTIALNPLTRQTEDIRGCVPAMGYSFAAGTTDGPGAFDFTQGTTTDNRLWNLIRNFLIMPSDNDIECHSPKPILLATGEAKIPCEWQPKVVPTQILKIGNVLITAVPGEFTTMAGRRLRNQVRKAAQESSGNEFRVVLAGLSNMYTSYITTPEEYQAQRYEAASTIYGPQTLTIYIDQFQKLTKALMDDVKVEAGPLPLKLDGKVFSLNTPVIFDSHPLGRDFGSCITEPLEDYRTGDTVRVSFISGNPRNSLRTEGTFLTVERQNEDDSWSVVLTDANWETRFQWERVASFILGLSNVHISWQITHETEPGTYRIRHFGNYKYFLGGIFPYDGATRNFNVRA